MSEKITNGKITLVDYICDHCQKGEMIANVTEETGVTLTSNWSDGTRFVPRYEHVCNKCGHKANFNIAYPRATRFK